MMASSRPSEPLRSVRAATMPFMDTMEISGVEKAKIACAERLFDEASTSDVRYHQVADYDDLLQWVGRLE